MEQFTLTRDEGNHLKITQISSLSSAICPAAFVRHLNGNFEITNSKCYLLGRKENIQVITRRYLLNDLFET